MVEVNICQNRGKDRPLGASFLVRDDLTVVDRWGLRKYIYKIQEALIADSSFQKLKQGPVRDRVKVFSDINLDYGTILHLKSSFV